jgi:arylformamidase
MDAPFHFSPNGLTAEAIALDRCIGPCEVLPLASLPTARAERVLVKASGGAPTPEQIAALPAGLKLFGTDGPSVDPMDSKTLDAHHALWKRGAVILEGLVLDAVPDGAYELIALPLKLVGMDAAPVRAVLIDR